jgi:hypothetical protein
MVLTRLCPPCPHKTSPERKGGSPIPAEWRRLAATRVDEFYLCGHVMNSAETLLIHAITRGLINQPASFSVGENI